jgi:preprotein translocase subunit SecE
MSAASEGFAHPRRTRRRKPAVQFLREVRLEMKKVDWPTRREILAYTTVVLVTLTVTTLFVFGLDYVFTNTIVKLFGA